MIPSPSISRPEMPARVLLHSISSGIKLINCVQFSIDDLRFNGYVPSHETHDSQRSCLDGRRRRRGFRPRGPVAARRDPDPAARPHRRGQHSRRRPRSRTPALRDAGHLAHAAARSPEGAGGRRAGRIIAQPRRPRAAIERAGPCRTVRRHGRPRRPRRTAGLRKHHGYRDRRDRAAALRDVRLLSAPRHARLFSRQPD